MKKTFNHLFLLLIIVHFVPSNLLAEENNINSEMNKFQIQQEKIIKLEEQNKLLTVHLEELRNSYYWSLYFAATFLLLFLGVNVYFLKNRYDEDKANILREVTFESEKIKNHLDLKFQNNVDKLGKDLDAQVSDKVNKASVILKNEIANNKKNIKLNEMDILDLEIKLNIESNLESTLLTNYYKLAKKVNSLNEPHWDWKTSKSLEEIYSLLTKGIKFDTMELPDVVSFLDSLPKQFGTSVIKIKDNMNNN